MVRRRKSSVRRREDADPAAVLAGREDVSPEDLFRLIHRVNPTGQELEARYERRLYEQKSRLQSLLVRRHADLVAVAPTERDGVVSLGHRSGFLDACHAVVDELEPDARAWVRRQLDLAALPEAGEEPSAPAAATADDGEPTAAETLLARAERAVRGYEYDVAERCLVRALGQSGGAPEAALPLLELWVELLGMDEQALAVEGRLGPRAREHPRVRSLLALAAARHGEEERALGLVRALPGARAAEIHAELAAGAVRRRDPEAASRHLAAVEILDPSEPRLGELRQAVAELLAADVRPAEEALELRFRREGALAVEGEARALLERRAQSEVARRILHEAGELKRRHQIDATLELADTALAEDRLRDAEKRLRAALEAGSDRPGLGELIADVRRRAEEREDEERLAAAVAAFAGEDERAAHLAYLALAAPLRERARQALRRPTLAWLEAAAAPATGQRAHAAVAAVLALERAAAVAGGDPRAALDELAPHLKTLRAVDAARALASEADARLEEGRRRGAQAALAAAAGGSAGELGALLAQVDAGALDAGGREVYAELRQRHERAEARARLVAEHRRAIDEGDFLAARDRARQLAEDAADEPTRRRWQEETQALRERIRRLWAVEIDAEERPLSEIRDFRPALLYESVEAWVDDDGGEMVLADVKGFWLFIRVVDLRRQRLIERVSLHAPSIVAPVSVWREGELVRILDDFGCFLELRRDGWEVLRWVRLREVLPQSTVLRQALPVPGSPYVWFEVHDLNTEKLIETRTVVLDLATLRVSREHSATSKAVIFHPEGPHVVCRDDDTRLFTGRGVAVPDGRLAGRFAQVAPVPGGGLLALQARSRDLSSAVLKLFRSGEGTAEEGLRPAGTLTVPDCQAQEGKLFATSHHEGIAFLLFRNAAAGTELLAAAISEQGIETLYRLPFAWDAVFVQDRRGRRLFAVHLAGDHLRVHPLGASPPRCAGPVLGSPDARGVPGLQGPFICEVGAPVDIRHALIDQGLLGDQEELWERVEKNPYPVIAGLLYARKQKTLEGLEEAFETIHERLPDEPAVRYALAVLATDADRWDEVDRWLRPVDPAAIGGGFRRHFLHLLGLSSLAEGRWREARERFVAGSEEEQGQCSFGQLIELTQILEKGELADEDWGVDRPLLWQVCGATQAADRALAAGDHAAAVKVLDRPAVWAVREVQSAARLAAACMEIEPATPAELFLKRQALGFFYEVRTESGIEYQELDASELSPALEVRTLLGQRRRSLDLVPWAWAADRLSALSLQAYEWLARQARD